MRKALPIITEDGASLRRRLQHEHDGRKTPRLQMLYVLATGQAQTRQDVARLISGPLAGLAWATPIHLSRLLSPL